MKSFPFDSKILQGKDGDTQYDRAIDSKTLREYFHLLYSNGVFAGENSDCFRVIVDSAFGNQPTQSLNTKIKLTVLPGACNIEGALGIESKKTTIEIDPFSCNYIDSEDYAYTDCTCRMDSIVLRLNTNIDARKISIEYKKGKYVKEPGDMKPPELTRNSTIYELRLANITMPSTGGHEDPSICDTILQEQITDTRYFSNDCGVVLSNPTHIDTQKIFEQYKSAIDNDLKDLRIWQVEWMKRANKEITDAADNLSSLIQKDESGKIILDLKNYMEMLQEFIDNDGKLEKRVNELQDSSETLQKTTLPTINNNIDRLKKTVNEDIQNTLHSNGTSINSLGDRIGTLVSRVSTLEDKIREGFFFNKRLKTFRLYVGNNSIFTLPLHLHVKKDGSWQTVKLMKALEEEWRDKYRPKLLYDEDNDSREQGFRYGGEGCHLTIDSKYFRREFGQEEDSPDFCLKRGKTKGLLLVKFCIDKYSDYPHPSFQDVVRFCANGSTYHAYEYSAYTYYWTIPINDSDPDEIDLDFNFDWYVTDTKRSNYDVSIEFNFTLTYIYC